MAVGKAERLVIFYARVAAAPLSANAGEARRLLDETLATVEDEFSGVRATEPPPLANDGRMYPARDDNVFGVPNRPDLIRLRQRLHDTYLGANGAILIRRRLDGIVELDIPGADGKRVEIDHAEL